AHLAAAGHRPPDREGDGRLGDAEDQPDHDRGAVLHVDQPTGADQRAVAAGPGAERGGQSASLRGGAAAGGGGAPRRPPPPPPRPPRPPRRPRRLRAPRHPPPSSPHPRTRERSPPRSADP